MKGYGSDLISINDMFKIKYTSVLNVFLKKSLSYIVLSNTNKKQKKYLLLISREILYYFSSKIY